MDKHIFVLEESPHNEPLFEFLFHQMGVLPERVTVLFRNALSPTSNTWLDKHPGLAVGTYGPTAVPFGSAKSITFMSILPWNAKIICDLRSQHGVAADKFRVIITDDEIERWNQVFEAHGRLVEDPAQAIDQHVLEALQFVNHFNMSRVPWGDILEKILGRTIECSNTQTLFIVLPDRSVAESLDKTVVMPSRVASLEKNEVRLLVLSKPRHARESIPWLLELLDYVTRATPSPTSPTLLVSLWSHSNFRHPVYGSLTFLIHYIGRLRGIHVSFSSHLSSSREIYYVHLMSHHALLMQDRGGLTAMNSFVLQGGLLCVSQGGLNHSLVRSNYQFAKHFVRGESRNVIEQVVSALSQDRLELFRENAARAEQGWREHQARARTFYLDSYS